MTIEGDSFHRYNRAEMRDMVKKAEAGGNKNFSHFGADANLFDKLEEMFKAYGENGAGKNATTCTARKRPLNTTSASAPASSPVNSRRGKTSRPVPT